MNVGELRKLLDELPDDMQVLMTQDGPPNEVFRVDTRWVKHVVGDMYYFTDDISQQLVAVLSRTRFR